MSNLIFNPFNRIAGLKSLLYGLVAMLITISIAYFSGMHFPDTLSIKAGADSTFNISFRYLAIQALANWLIISTILYIMALIFSKSTVRAIDVYGTQAFARSPYIIASTIGFSKAIDRFAQFALWTNMGHGEPITLTSLDITIATLQILVVTLSAIWMVALSVNGYKVSANIKGAKLTIIYTVSLIASMAVSGYISHILHIAGL